MAVDLHRDLTTHPLTRGLEIIDARVAGRPDRTLVPVGLIDHHTASRRGSGNLPSLRTCQVGRPDVAGPLCNVLTGRRGTVAIITDGSANHSGKGNSAALERMRRGQPPHDLDPYRERDDHWHISDETIGHEIENNGLGEPYPPVQIDAVRRVDAALCDIYGIDPRFRLIGHKEWTSRKIDPVFDMDAHRLQVAALLALPPDPDPEPIPEMEDDAVELVRKPKDTKIYALGGLNRMEVTRKQADAIAQVYGLLDANGKTDVKEMAGDVLAKFRPIEPALTLADISDAFAGWNPGDDCDPEAIAAAVVAHLAAALES